MKSRIMYIECKDHDIPGPAYIECGSFSKTGSTLYYGGIALRSLRGKGFKANYYNVTTGD